MALWTPAEISTALWLDASDASTVTLESGAVSQWADKSGRDWHASQAITSRRPTVSAAAVNGLDALAFNGTSHVLVIPGAVGVARNVGTELNVFCVCRPTATSTAAYFRVFNISVGAASNSSFRAGVSLYQNQLRFAQRRLDGDTASLSDYGYSTTRTLLFHGRSVWSDATLRYRIDGGSEVSKATGQGAGATSDTSSTEVAVGGNNYNGNQFAAMLCCELVVAPVGTVADATRELIEGYLAHKWGIAGSLPAAHPYKASPPLLGSGVVSVLAQPWDLPGDGIVSALAQPWSIFDWVGMEIDHPWGLRLGAELREPWTSAPVRRASLLQPWRGAGMLSGPLAQPWRDAVGLAAGLAQEWDILAPLAVGLVQPWAIAADTALVGPLAQGWDLRDVVPLSADLAQPWTIGTDPALLRYTLSVTIDGHQVQVDSLTLEADLDQDAIHCTLSLGDLSDYQRCRDLCQVVVRVAINGGSAEEYHLVLTSARIDERHGETRYEVQAESALVLLGAPYAEPVSVEEYTGAASVIAATLCAPLTLAWQTVDWTLPSGALVAAGETPLELLKRLAAAVGAVVQARPDGSVRIVPEYPISLPAWPTATPDLVWIETERSEQLAGQPERRPGYNKYLIGETLTAADSLRLEEETISETVKLVRGYQVPWTGLFSLVHTGGSWVQVEDLGIETRQETETIEIVAGEGRVRYPILSRDAVRWLHVSLGALTVSEDGTVRADVAGQSLCEVTYTTRCRKWRVRDGRNEQLQLVAEI